MTGAPRLVVLDLDGTLLDDAGDVSDRNSSALRRAEDDGARVVIATGRPPRWLEHLRADIPATIAVCCNGGLVMDLESDTVLAAHPLDGSRLQQAITELRARGLRFAAATEGLPEVGLTAEHSFPARGDRVVPRATLADLCAGIFVKVLVRPELEDAAAVVEHFGRDYATDFTLTRSTNDGLIEISAAGITKGAVIDGLAREWGIASADAIAFGDMPNDIEMLLWAGHSVAMGNADDAVKAITTEVAGDHDQSGVGVVLERWF
ncbi:HAD family hydrolase [Lacisediminihabitans changchengi]|uniref:HAD family hydrolase n=1 Tax=Lacisediminihabitans changchengi TaxID=2787634 RepID=A0A934ST38_9MICO|nr:HAD family hydrolase [Lacisediminihabitans changchengi]MBK4347624.1 HAD family hydrolase [Lacisediminihabitans changchengi]